MSLIAVIIALAVAGGLSLWVSGLLAGGRIGASRGGGQEALVRDRDDLRASLLGLHQRLGRVEEQLSDERAARRAAEEEVVRAEAEMERAAGELGRAEAELNQAGLEISRLEARLKAATMEREERPAARPAEPGTASVPSVPRTVDPKMTMAIGYVRDSALPATVAEDSALAERDLERVAHGRTRQALEEARARIERLEAEVLAASRPSSPAAAVAGGGSIPPPRAGRGGAGFQTVSIATRDQAVPGFEHERLRRAHDQLKAEHERLAAEHAAVIARVSGFDKENEPGE